MYTWCMYTWLTVCLYAQVGNGHQVEVTHFLDWMKLEPQSMVWIPVMHRLSGAEGARHHARCAVCRNAPIVGIRYIDLMFQSVSQNVDLYCTP